MQHTIPSIEDEFSSITVKVDRRLSSNEVQQVAGCLGYALARMNGESLGDPESIVRGHDFTSLTFFFDSTKCFRNSYSFEEAFEDALVYITEGTPVRRTNRAGAGTAGTRLIEGIGACVVRLSVGCGEPDPLTELEATRARVLAAQREFSAAVVRFVEMAL